jgi:hypothetical protein
MTDEPSSDLPTWENLVVELDMTDPANSRAILDKHGRNSWELVAVVYVQPLHGVTGQAFLKREIKD